MVKDSQFLPTTLIMGDYIELSIQKRGYKTVANNCKREREREREDGKV